MPNYAYLATPVLCPYCAEPVVEWVAFQWGFSPGYDVHAEWEYQVGDPIAWRRCPDGSILPWTQFRQGTYPHETNLGDPAFADVVVQAQRTFYWVTPSQRPTCPRCQRQLEGAAVEIRKGIIKRAWIYLPGELDHAVPGYALEASDALRPMQEWADHALVMVDTC